MLPADMELQQSQKSSTFNFSSRNTGTQWRLWNIALYLSQILEEVLHLEYIRINYITGNKSLYDVTNSLTSTNDRLLRVEIAEIRQLRERKQVTLQWVEGKHQLSDCLTKRKVHHGFTYSICWREDNFKYIVYGGICTCTIKIFNTTGTFTTLLLTFIHTNTETHRHHLLPLLLETYSNGLVTKSSSAAGHTKLGLGNTTHAHIAFWHTRFFFYKKTIFLDEPQFS